MSTENLPTAVATLCELDSNHLDDSAWLQSLRWRKSADEQLKSNAKTGDISGFATAWTKLTKDLTGLSPKKTKQLLQRLETLFSNTGTLEEIPSLTACLFGDITNVSAAVFQNATPTTQELLAAAWILLLRTKELDAETTVSLWCWTLLETQKHFTSESNLITTSEDLKSILCVELKVMCGSLFGDLKGGKKFLKAAVQDIGTLLHQSTDNDGTPQAKFLPDIDSHLAVFARLVILEHVTQQEILASKTRIRSQHCFQRAMTLLSRDYQSFRLDPGPANLERWHTLSELLQGDQRSCSALLKSWVNGKKPKNVGVWALPDESHQSDWAYWACLRDSWPAPSSSCHILHNTPLPRLDVVTSSVPFLSGEWGLQVRSGDQAFESNGKPHHDEEVEAHWSNVCWFSDYEAAYLELRREQKGWGSVNRQLLFIREEQLLVIADVVDLEAGNEFDYVSQLPFSSGWHAEQDTLSRELALSNGDVRVRVFPLSSPQLKVDKSATKTTVSPEALTVTHHGDQCRAQIVTVFDWNPKHRLLPIEWTKLTVAEDGKRVPSDQATGYRLRVGHNQWLLYQSLTEPDVPRSVLGLHTANEMVFAKVEAGEVEPIVEVEG